MVTVSVLDKLTPFLGDDLEIPGPPGPPAPVEGHLEIPGPPGPPAPVGNYQSGSDR